MWVRRAMPTAEQGIRCVILCQYLTGKFVAIAVVRMDERTRNLFILAGDNIEIEVYLDGLWRYL
jgi:hypothetical protein